MINKKKLQAGYTELFNRMKYPIAGHITFNRGKLHEDFIKDKLVGLIKRYYRAELGKKWKNKLDKHIKWIAIFENGSSKGNSHIHLLLDLNLSSKKLKKLEIQLNTIWKKLILSGDIQLEHTSKLNCKIRRTMKYIRDFFKYILSGGKQKMKRYKTHKEILNRYLCKEITPNKDIWFYTEKDVLE